MATLSEYDTIRGDLWGQWNHHSSSSLSLTYLMLPPALHCLLGIWFYPLALGFLMNGWNFLTHRKYHLITRKISEFRRAQIISPFQCTTHGIISFAQKSSRYQSWGFVFLLGRLVVKDWTLFVRIVRQILRMKFHDFLPNRRNTFDENHPSRKNGIFCVSVSASVRLTRSDHFKPHRSNRLIPEFFPLLPQEFTFLHHYRWWIWSFFPKTTMGNYMVVK